MTSGKIYGWGILLLVGGLALFPLLFLVLGSFTTGDMLGQVSMAHLGLQNYVEVFSSPSTYKVLVNTLIYTTGTVLFSLVSGTFFAWVLARTDIPYRSFLFSALVVSIAVPSLLQAMAWVFLFSPRMGYVNQLLMPWLGRPLYNIYSLPSMIFLEGLRMIPAVFLLMWPLLRHIPSSLEECAMICGARGSTVFRRIVLPLIVPGLVGVSIYVAITVIGVFEIPGIIGLPARIFVFSTRVYAEIFSPGAANYGNANALSMVLVVLLVIGGFFYYEIIKRVHRFEIITGKGYQPRQIVLRPAIRRLLLGVILLYLFLSLVLPTLTLLWTSFVPLPMPPSWAALDRLTLEGWHTVFTVPGIGRTIVNTLVVSIVASVGVIALSFAVSFILVRTDAPYKRTLDMLAFSPHAVPGVVLGISLVFLFVYMDRLLALGLYGTIWPIAVGFIIAFLPFGTRATTAGLLQLHKELEEAGSICGAARWRVLSRISFPLLMPTFLIVFLWTFGHVFRMTGLPLMLFGSEKSQVIGVLLWFMWDDSGQFNAVSALGICLILFLLLTSLVLYRLQRANAAGRLVDA